MNCECNNNSNRVKPRIKHVYGNVLRMAIPLTLRTLVKDGDEMIVNDTDFIPSSDHLVRVVFSKGKTNYPITATMDGNVAIIEDKGKIPEGTYDISVECYDDLGNPYRFKQNAVLYVTDTTAEAGIDEEIEYEAQTWYLNAAVFLATTEIGEIGDVIDAKLDDVFGNVLYDANAKEIRFYNKNNSRVLATIDSRPFIVDGTVADVYIDVSRQVLVVVLNEDAGGRRFSVPLYLVFNSYYKKDEVDSLVSRKVEGVRLDFSQELPFVVHVTQDGSSFSSDYDFGAIGNAIMEDDRVVVACVNNTAFLQLLVASGEEIIFSQVFAEDSIQTLLRLNDRNEWSMEDVDLGTGGGSGGYEPPVGGIPKSDLAQSVQDALDAVANKVDKETGKGLSTNDYTTAEKNKLASLENYDDSALQTAIDGKVDKESGKSLMTDAERTKLQGIAAGAEVNVQPNWTQTNTSADDYIKNKPTIPAAQVNSDWNASTGKAAILNKPTIPVGIANATTSEDGTWTMTLSNGEYITIDLNHDHPQYVESDDLADVATSGSYDDLTDKPVIYTKTEIDNKGFITTETDPTVPSWAKQSSKPTYTAQEVGALPATTTIPTKVSDLTNDSGFTSNAGTITGITMNGASKGTSGVVNLGTVVTAHQDISGKANKSEMDVSTSGDQTTITLKTGTSATVINQHQSLSGYAKYELLANEAAYTALTTKDSGTLYLIPES